MKESNEKEEKYYYRPKGFNDGKWCPTTKEFHELNYLLYDFKIDMTDENPSAPTEATEVETVEHPELTALKEATKRIYAEYSASSEAFKYGYKAGFTDACEWQLQHTAKALAESQARVKELEDCLRELWPLSTNAFGELTIDEIEADVTLNHLSEAIDKAKELLKTSNPNN